MSLVRLCSRNLEMLKSRPRKVVEAERFLLPRGKHTELNFSRAAAGPGEEAEMPWGTWE